MRLTKHRQEILNKLEKSSKALSAQSLHSSLPHINLVTIYRNLESFVKAGMIKKLHLNNQEAYYEKQKTPHHHAVCNDCERVIHFIVKDKEIIRKLDFSDFVVSDLEITVRGTCKNKHQKSRR